MGKTKTLLAMLAGATIAYGVMNKAKTSEPRPATDPLDDELNELKKEKAHEESDRSWKAGYTIDGDEVDPEEVKDHVKEETARAVAKFREDAKVASEEILIGLKKALAEMKTAVDSARKAAAERRAAETPQEEEAPCCCRREGEEAPCCCEENSDDSCGEDKNEGPGYDEDETPEYIRP